MEKIDTLDKKILEIIMKNARIPSKDVAQVCGVSRAAVHQRIQRLIDDGIITGSSYNVNPKSLGYSTCTFIGLTLERGSMYRNVVPELLKIKEVVECHFTTGLCPRQRASHDAGQRPHPAHRWRCRHRDSYLSGTEHQPHTAHLL